MSRKSPVMNVAISVVVSTHNRPVSLARTVRSILSQSYKPLELIIVNDGETEVAADLSVLIEDADIRYIYRRLDRASLPASRNAGAEAANGDVILFLDDDVELASDFLQQLAEMYQADLPAASDEGGSGYQVDGIGAIGTDVGLVPSGPIRKKIWDFLMFMVGHTRWMPRRCLAAYRLLPLSLRGRLRPARFIIGGRLSLRRHVIEAIKFNEDFAGYAVAEDRDFSYRATQKFALFVAPELKLIHHCELQAKPDWYSWGEMMVINHFRVVRDTLEEGVGKWMLLAWDLMGLIMVHLVYSLFGNRELHWNMARGLIGGIYRVFCQEAISRRCAY